MSNNGLHLSIIPQDLMNQYLLGFDDNIQAQFETLVDSPLSKNSFSFYTSVSAVFSSKIEGEDIELDSFIKHKRLGVNFQPDYTRKTDDLYAAYAFAHQNRLNRSNLDRAHLQLTSHILHRSKQGKIRSGNMFVITPDGKIDYVAATPESVGDEMKKFYHDLKLLLSSQLSFSEVFYFASMLHLVLVKIHPYEDGNGRIYRLLEKWFLAEKLGSKAWFIQSERNYYQNHSQYYHNIRLLGMEYDHLDYSKALPFLNMLPNSLIGFDV